MLKTESLRLIAYFFKAYPRRSVLIVFLLGISGLFEGIGVFSLFPVLELATGDPGGEDSRLMQLIRAAIAPLGLEPTLGVLLSIIVIGMTLKGAFMWLAIRQVGYTVAHVCTDLRLMLIRAMVRARWSYFVSQRAGHISNAVGNEAHRASMAYSAACLLLAVIIQVFVYAVVGFIVASWSVAAAAIAAGLLVMLLMNGLVRMSREAGLRQTQLVKSLSGRLIDALHSLKPIKAMAQERHLQPLLEAETRELNEAQRRQVLASGTLTSLQEPILVLMLAAGLYVVLSIGGIPFSGVLLMVFIFHRLVGRIHMLQMHYQGLAVSESAFWSLRESVELAEAQREETAGVRTPPPLERGIEVRNVRFAYGEGDVLKNVSLDIPAGQFVAVVGPSGAGKTTLIDVLIGLYRPQEGEVFVDGVALGEIDLLAWRHMIGYVPQEMLLFHDTVLHNVTLGDEEIDRPRVEQALKSSGAWDFVSQLPAGLDTVIGERGSRLSGGQRQRIAIARALVRQPRLLVLDEVTTALDPVTEAAICQTLKGLGGSHTIVSISHQPALREVADIVYRLQEGRLVEEKARELEPSLAPRAAASDRLR